LKKKFAKHLKNEPPRSASAAAAAASELELEKKLIKARRACNLV